MPRVDYEAVVLDLRGALAERPSWSSTQLRAKVDELEQRHRLPPSTTIATGAPLAPADPPGTSGVMGAGADDRSPVTTETP